MENNQESCVNNSDDRNVVNILDKSTSIASLAKLIFGPNNVDGFDGIFPLAAVVDGLARKSWNFLVALAKFEVEADVDLGISVSLVVVPRNVDGTSDSRHEMRRNA